MVIFNNYVKIISILTMTTFIFILTQMIHQNSRIDSLYLRIFASSSTSQLNLTPCYNFSCCYKENSSTIIFLHLSNKSNEWLPLEICVFKSAAVMNNNTGVCVLTKSHMKSHPVLTGLANLQIELLDIDLLIHNTPLASWYQKYVLNKTFASIHVLHELSDALRFAYLYKYGGKYMDTDVLTLRNLSGLNNTIAWYDANTINGAVMFFEKRHPFLKAALDGFNQNFIPGYWGSVGPLFITKLHRQGLVNRSTYTAMEKWTFYPIHFTEAELAFQANKKDLVKARINGSYVFHSWRQIVNTLWWPNVTLNNGSFMEEYVRNGCSV